MRVTCGEVEGDGADAEHLKLGPVDEEGAPVQRTCRAHEESTWVYMSMHLKLGPVDDEGAPLARAGRRLAREEALEAAALELRPPQPLVPTYMPYTCHTHEDARVLST